MRGEAPADGNAQGDNGQGGADQAQGNPRGKTRPWPRAGKPWWKPNISSTGRLRLREMAAAAAAEANAIPLGVENPDGPRLDDLGPNARGAGGVRGAAAGALATAVASGAWGSLGQALGLPGLGPLALGVKVVKVVKVAKVA